jgi:hypothetical protein
MGSTSQQSDCTCIQGSFHYQGFERRDLGMDSNYGEVTIERCKGCGRYWLNYLMEYEYLTAAGRWFRGVIPPEIAASLNAESAKQILESMEWYFRGGSAFGGQVTRTSSGQLKYWLTPFEGPSAKRRD